MAVLWIWITRVGARVLARCGAGIGRLWRAIFGRKRVTTTRPRPRWYTNAVDSAFGIPPAGMPLDPVTSRRALRRPRPANRPRAARRPSERAGGETINLRNATRTSPDAELTRDTRARYVGRQVSRRGERRKSEELLAAALARFRAARTPSRDHEPDGDDR
jgi:hypothetical protein